MICETLSKDFNEWTRRIKEKFLLPIVKCKKDKKEVNINLNWQIKGGEEFKVTKKQSARDFKI